METAKNFLTNATKIVGIGPNYKSLCLEINWPIPDEDNWPNIFLKPTTAFVENEGFVEIPKGSETVLFEVEFAIIIGKKAKGVSRNGAMDYVGGYAVALDMTALDWLTYAREKGRPWLFAKGFDTSCPVSSWIDPECVPDPHNVNIWCKVNGEQRQDANTCDMIFSVPKIIEMISETVTLLPGDVILTGSAPGQGTVKIGDIIEFGAKGLVEAKVFIK